MSDAHTTLVEDLEDDNYVIPVSAGIAPEMRWFLVVAFLIVLMQGTFVCISSGFGRAWPATNSTKIDLH